MRLNWNSLLNLHSCSIWAFAKQSELENLEPDTLKENVQYIDSIGLMDILIKIEICGLK